jgi:hypothetical protein
MYAGDESTAQEGYAERFWHQEPLQCTHSSIGEAVGDVIEGDDPNALRPTF